jgi:hypothetical protein
MENRMSERGVCICPNCGCRFSDTGKVQLEQQRDRYKRIAHAQQKWMRLRRRIERLLRG